MTIRVIQTDDGVSLKLRYKGYLVTVDLDNFEGHLNEYTHPNVKVLDHHGRDCSHEFSFRATGRNVDIHALLLLFQEIDYVDAQRRRA